MIHIRFKNIMRTHGYKAIKEQEKMNKLKKKRKKKFPVFVFKLKLIKNIMALGKSQKKSSLRGGGIGPSH